MQALVKDGSGVGVRKVSAPVIARDDDVLIRVAAAGVCRTDVFVARGLLPSRTPVVLGHELSGFVEQTGERAEHLRGARVTVMPFLPCETCAGCAAATACLRPRMLGMQADGAFAGQLLVPARCVHALPDEVGLLEGAYVEPVAAALAVCGVPMAPNTRVLVAGENRIAELVGRVLAHRGLQCVKLNAAEVEPDSFDVAVETVATEEVLAALVRAVRPGGTVVLKSRPHRSAALDVKTVVEKELVLRGVKYAPFEEAIQALASGLGLSGLLGERLPLARWQEAFADAPQQEATKTFLCPDPGLFED